MTKGKKDLKSKASGETAALEKTVSTAVCETRCVHTDAVERVTRGIHGSDLLMEGAALFKVLGDHTRIRILDALRIEELCVCDLTAVLGMSQSAVSHQLRVLRGARIVKFRKQGKMVYYSLDDAHVHQLLEDGLAHVLESRPPG